MFAEEKRFPIPSVADLTAKHYRSWPESRSDRKPRSWILSVVAVSSVAGEQLRQLNTPERHISCTVIGEQHLV
jgi:hypothetical protein